MIQVLGSWYIQTTASEVVEKIIKTRPQDGHGKSAASDRIITVPISSSKDAREAGPIGGGRCGAVRSRDRILSSGGPAATSFSNTKTSLSLSII